MRTFSFTLPLFLSMLALPSLALADTLEVGPGKPYAKPCEAIAAAKANDTIAIAAGTYTDTCAVNTAGLTIKGVGGRPKIDLSSGTPAQQKGIYVILADGVTVENLELTGAHIDTNSGENGAGIRVQATNFTVRGCFIHDNQNGILGSPLSPGGSITIETSELSGNGQGNGCDDGNGCTHNLYLGPNFDKVVFRYNWSHHLATDAPDKGHLFKSRAQQNLISYNRFTAEGDTDSYEVELPQGGLAVLVGNLIEKGTMSGNPSLFAYGKEGLSNGDNRVFVVNNTFVNHLGKGTFIDIAGGAPLVAHNNLFVGMGAPSSTGALPADNLALADAKLADEASYDYHLLLGSPAIDQGVDPGLADALSLVPTEEYQHPAGHAARPVDAKLDVGAYEYGVSPGTGGGGTTGSGGGTTGSGGSGGSSATGGGSAAGTTGSGGSADTGQAGCSCRSVKTEEPLPFPALGLLFTGGLVIMGRRGGRARRRRMEA
ncbi:MAG: right-handed parallel beta-helix repeat-containing protein [Minicystis sp.]